MMKYYNTIININEQNVIIKQKEFDLDYEFFNARKQKRERYIEEVLKDPNFKQEKLTINTSILKMIINQLKQNNINDTEIKIIITFLIKAVSYLSWMKWVSDELSEYTLRIDEKDFDYLQCNDEKVKQYIKEELDELIENKDCLINEWLLIKQYYEEGFNDIVNHYEQYQNTNQIDNWIFNKIKDKSNINNINVNNIKNEDLIFWLIFICYRQDKKLLNKLSFDINLLWNILNDSILEFEKIESEIQKLQNQIINKTIQQKYFKFIKTAPISNEINKLYPDWITYNSENDRLLIVDFEISKKQASDIQTLLDKNDSYLINYLNNYSNE